MYELVGRSRDHRDINLVAFLSDSFTCIGLKTSREKTNAGFSLCSRFV